jgi:hypothetical protein
VFQLMAEEAERWKRRTSTDRPVPAKSALGTRSPAHTRTGATGGFLPFPFRWRTAAWRKKVVIPQRLREQAKSELK